MKSIIECALATLFLGWVSIVSAAAQTDEAAPEVPIESLPELETFVDATIDAQMKAFDVPAITVSIVKDGEMIFAKGYGLANIEKQIPVTAEETLFRPGSTSKLFTWTAVMQQVEQGKVNLDADVNTYLNTFQIPATYDEPITLRHILAHTAGFEEGGLGYLIIYDPAKATSLREAMATHIPRRINPPGKYSSYSNYATALAGLIVENVSGIPFNDYIKQNILDPLGMTRSTFEEPLPDHLKEGMAVGYKRDTGAFKPEPFEIIKSFGPAGALSSTSTDMAKFMLAHLNDGQLGESRILQADTAQLMHSRLFGGDDRLSGMAYGFYEEYVNGHRLIGHGGDTMQFHTNMVIDKDEDLGIFISTMGVQGGKARSEFVQAFYDHYYPSPLTQIAPPADFNDRSAQYAGTYVFWRHNQSTLEKAAGLAGGLEVVPTEDNTLMLAGLFEPRQFVEIGDNLFRQVDGPLRIAFGEDEGGNIRDLYIDGFPFMAASRQPAAEGKLFSQLLPGVSLFLFATVWVGWLYRRKEFKTMTGDERMAIKFSMALSGVTLVFIVLLVSIILVEQEGLFSEIPTLMKVTLVLPDIAAILSLGVAWFAVKAWREGFWRKGRRIHYTLVALSGLYMSWFYYYWNFLGIQVV